MKGAASVSETCLAYVGYTLDSGQGPILCPKINHMPSQTQKLLHLVVLRVELVVCKELTYMKKEERRRRQAPVSLVQQATARQRERTVCAICRHVHRDAW
jgi:precorrin-6B methylase 1